MEITSTAPGKRTYDVLRGFKRPQTRKKEKCELCGTLLGEPHPHLLELTSGQIACACPACAMLFAYREGLRYARIPDRPRRLADFQISDADWNALALPIDMAFFLHRSSEARTVAYYPSPAGCTESLLSFDDWAELTRHNPAIARMSPDVEALLINRTRGRRDYYVAPLDDCYRLTGLIRIHWRGLSGGDAVWREIDAFFDSLAGRAVTEGAEAHA